MMQEFKSRAGWAASQKKWMTRKVSKNAKAKNPVIPQPSFPLYETVVCFFPLLVLKWTMNRNITVLYVLLRDWKWTEKQNSLSLRPSQSLPLLRKWHWIIPAVLPPPACNIIKNISLKKYLGSSGYVAEEVHLPYSC